MFFKKLLAKIPFIRKRMIKSIRVKLTEILEDFDSGAFNDIYVKALQSILKSPVINFNEELVLGSINPIKTFSNSSAALVLSIEKKEVKKSVMVKNGSVALTQNTRSFSRWYSNKESIETFVGVISVYLEKQVMLMEPVLVNGDKVVEVVMTPDEDEFLDSLLYRLALVDLVNIVDFYLEEQEIKHDQRKENKGSSFWKK